MQKSKSDLVELNLDDQDIDQLTCCLKNAIFSKFISSYLIEKTEEMWILYEKRINKYLKDKNFNINCHYTRPQTVIQLEELIKNQEENIEIYQRNICSLYKQLQPTQNSPIVPKTPRCIDRYKTNLDD